MEKKSTKIAYFVALGVFIVLLVILGVMFKDAPLPTLEVDGEMIEATTPFSQAPSGPCCPPSWPSCWP